MKSPCRPRPSASSAGNEGEEEITSGPVSSALCHLCSLCARQHALPCAPAWLEMNFGGLKQQQAEITEPSATPQHQYEKHSAPADHLMASAVADFENPSADRLRWAARWARRSGEQYSRPHHEFRSFSVRTCHPKLDFTRETRLQQRLWAASKWAPALRCYVTEEYVIVAHPAACNLSEVTDGSSDTDVSKVDFRDVCLRQMLIFFFFFFDMYSYNWRVSLLGYWFVLKMNARPLEVISKWLQIICLNMKSCGLFLDSAPNQNVRKKKKKNNKRKWNEDLCIPDNLLMTKLYSSPLWPNNHFPEISISSSIDSSSQHTCLTFPTAFVHSGIVKLLIYNLTHDFIAVSLRLLQNLYVFRALVNLWLTLGSKSSNQLFNIPDILPS